MVRPVAVAQTRVLQPLRDLLNAAEDAAPGAVIEVVARQMLVSLGALEVGFLIADLSGDSLFPVARVGVEPRVGLGDPGDSVLIHDSRAGIALRRQKTQIADDRGDVTVCAPVTARGDAIGVLELRLPKRPDRSSIEEIEATAHALAYIVITNGRHTDLFEWGQRTRPMTLAAEIQRRLIPDSFVCEAGQFTLAGWLEPLVDSAGDTFDYSFNKAELSCSLTDAMGHSVEASLLATLAVSALRNARRSGSGIDQAAMAANEALLAHARAGQFVTGLLMDVSLDDGVVTIVNAGHPPPFLFRAGKVEQLQLEVDLPFGVVPGEAYRLQRLELQAGDRLILVTDGLLERSAEAFDMRSVVQRSASLHPREFVRELCREVTSAAGGRLEDDATVLCVDWHGGAGLSRRSSAGADESGASR